MGNLQVQIINPKATKLLRQLADLNLISILKKTGKASGKREQVQTNLDLYPFKPQYLKYAGVNYILREKLTCDVSIADDQYVISCDLLDLSAWGATRDAAEEAFAFVFHTLFESFAKADDKKLSAKAKNLKRTLLNLVAQSSCDEG